MMRVSIERLRVWLLVGAGGLVLAIAAFLGYAHVRAHRFLKDLPARLGADITRESNGFTYSQSSKGKTVYTIHASKMVQRKDGKMMLHDVGIVLYGQRQDRADRIYGDEFEYDQKEGVVRAVGEVHLDLEAPAPTDARGRMEYASGGGPATAAPAPGAEERMVHVKTSGLVFVQKLGAASTAEEIEFEYHGMHGRAKGADFNSDTGMTVLQSDVRVSGLRDGEPVTLTASHAEMDRGTKELHLEGARYFAVSDRGPKASDGDRTLTAGQAVVHLRADGSVDRVVASGGVGLTQAGGQIKGQSADVTVSEGNRPEVVEMGGGLVFSEEEMLRQVQGRAERGTVRFDRAGRMETAAMRDGAEVQVRERAAATAVWNERTVSGERIDANFVTAAGRRTWMRDGTATGGARMLLVDRSGSGAKAAGTTSEMRGDVLTAQMIWTGNAARMSTVEGKGHTTLRRSDGLGGEDTSSGETVELSFAPGAAGGAKSGVGAGVSRAVQRGGVMLTHVPVRKAADGAAEVVRGSADEAVFVGGDDTLTLSGQAEMTEGDSVLRARTVTLRRGSGDATAEGGVRATYRQAGSTEPVHVIAATGDFKHDAGLATFHGGAGLAARLWQGGSQVEAPEIELDQRQKLLVARGTGAEVVRTVLVSGGAGAGAGAGAAGKARPQVMRVVSGGLRYSDAERRADFTGGVEMVNADGTVRGSEVVALLKPAAAPGASGGGLMGGSVERVTAAGAVEVIEQGRRATGERLVYTAADGMFVMTGTPATPPKVVDAMQGTITGAALQFHAGDNSVMVLGSGKGEGGRRVRTETQVGRP